MKVFDIMPANLWRENKHIESDLKLFAASRVDVVACNEAANWVEELKKVGGYRAVVTTQRDRQARNNVILVRNDLKVIDSGTRKMCDQVGRSPARYATWVAFWWDGVKLAVICTHVNSHIQAGRAKPHDLPRVDEAIEHVQNLGRLRRDLQARFDTVVIAGDLNWDWSGGPLSRQWRYAPRRFFARWGMLTNWDHRPTAPAGGTKGRRQIDYVAYKVLAWKLTRQTWIKGEYSDHDWLKVSLHGRRRPFRRWRIRHLGT